MKTLKQLETEKAKLIKTQSELGILIANKAINGEDFSELATKNKMIQSDLEAIEHERKNIAAAQSTKEAVDFRRFVASLLGTSNVEKMKEILTEKLGNRGSHEQ